MAEDNAANKSLTDQIVQDMLTALEGTAEFDKTTIEQLVQLAEKGELKKHAQVSKVIKPA